VPFTHVILSAAESKDDTDSCGSMLRMPPPLVPVGPVESGGKSGISLRFGVLTLGVERPEIEKRGWEVSQRPSMAFDLPAPAIPGRLV